MVIRIQPPITYVQLTANSSRKLELFHNLQYNVLAIIFLNKAVFDISNV